MFSCGVHRLFLNVEGVDFTRFADCAAEELGIVSVAHGEVDGDVARVKVLEDEEFLHSEEIKHGFIPWSGRAGVDLNIFHCI
jgi:acylphosphatase